MVAYPERAAHGSARPYGGNASEGRGGSDEVHTFTVVATDASGNTDPTPASDGWKVKKKK